LVVTISTLVHANVKEDKAYWDRILPTLNTTYWQKKASIAVKANDKAYTPDPYAVSGNLSSTVSE
jgi:pectate lyase